MKLRLRRPLLAFVGLVFAGLAVASLIAPETMAEGIGFRLDNRDARSEYRAIYVGLWLAHAAVFALAARRVEDVVLGDVCGLLLGGQVLGRIAAIVADGDLPSARLLPFAIAEAAGAAAILLLRPLRP